VDEIEGSSLGDMDMWSARFRKMQPSVSRLFLNNVENYSLRMLNTALRGCRRRAAELEYGWPQFSVEAAVPAADIVTQQATRLPLQDYLGCDRPGAAGRSTLAAACAW